MFYVFVYTILKNMLSECYYFENSFICNPVVMGSGAIDVLEFETLMSIQLANRLFHLVKYNEIEFRTRKW